MRKVRELIHPLIIIISFVIIGLIILYFLNINIKESFFAEIKKTSDVAIAAINPERVANLSQTLPGDITTTPDYIRLQDQVEKLGKSFSLNGIDAIYLVTKKGDKIYFIVDSTPFGESGYVIPGVLYEKPPQEIFKVYDHGIALKTDVYIDEYGQYISQFSPIVDFNSGVQVGVLGVDVDYSFYQKSYYQKVSIFLIIICCFFIFLYLYFRGIYRLNKVARISNEKINSISNAINDGVVVIDNNSLISFCNKASEKIFHTPMNKFIGLKFSDLVRVENVFDLRLEEVVFDFSFSFDNNLSGKTFELQIIANNEKQHYYEVSFKLTEVGGANYLVGVFHDISKRKDIEIELKKQKVDLEKINSLMVGRELKMIELKQEIARLKNKR